MVYNSEKQSWLDRPIFSFFPALNGEMLIFSLIILLTAISRLYDLGARVFSHDENLHVYFSWLYSIGKGYQYSPLMHGPLQFHLLALTYILFGASDFTARLPHAIASILTIILLWKWRRYLGRFGTLVAAGLMLISPFMLYYGRYARNEAFIGVIFVLTLYAILRYLETGKSRYLILLTIATILHFTAKETAFIYTAQALLFLAVYLINRVTRSPWKHQTALNIFLIILSIGVLLAGAALGITIYSRTQVATNASQTAAPIIPGQIPGVPASHNGQLSAASILLILAGMAFLLAIILLIAGYGWKNLCRERSFDMLILLGTFVLPQLAAFPVTALGGNPLDYQFTWPGWKLSALWAEAPVRTASVFFVLCIISVAIGLFWNKKRWIIYAALFWGIYILLFTSIFSNWQGFFVGTVGALGYWLQQQGVHRGDQPWYYYLLIQIPIYEFLPALGVFLAAYFGLRRKSPAPLGATTSTKQSETDNLAETSVDNFTVPAKDLPAVREGNFTFPLLIWWTVTSLLAFTMAGEKMPWLTVHITLPMILLTGWGLGQVIERVNWSEVRKRWGVLVTVLLVVLFISLSTVIVSLFGNNPPFQGKTLEQLSSTGAFLLSAGVTLASAIGIAYLVSNWQIRDALRIAVLVIFTLLALLTGRTAIRAAFINADNATEYLVYAHGASGIKDVMDQITTISGRIAGEQNLQIAYDANLPNQGVSWSFKWYLRNYPNATSFDTPDNSLRNFPVIIVDQQNFENIKPIVGPNYYQLDYIRMVWPNQDYFALTWPRIWNALTNPAMRDAIFQIWLNRDYSDYAKITGENGLTLSTWQPSARMELFIRKDIAAQMWEYGILQAAPLQADPYAKGTISLPADLAFGTSGNSRGQLNAPRGLAVAPDGSLYVADSRNHRIEHFDATGNLIQTFGQISPGCPYATVPPANVPIGTFCEPWGVAVSPDGQWVYVADTWNHRIQKLSASGTAIKTWGTPNYDPVSSGNFGLWGPRGIAVDSQGHVLVADTGNKRIIVYDADGNFISQFGGEGTAAGQFDEPVGLALDAQGNLYVADTWNQRIQVFVPNADKSIYTPSTQWDIAGWMSQSLDNKPYLAVDQQGHIFATDPDSFRVLEFTTSGEFVHAWGQNGTGMDNFGMPSGIAVDGQGRIWVSDAANNRLMRFTLP
ncbi:MAG: flippase activity-associated protein Agl23 [Anaerolineales bacterium]|jgi:predicted membrane-bound mannosyltransferase/DNA-binding beta-propeller fold protein YncE